MNHLESTFAGKNDFWRYIVMIAVIIITANTIGAMPLILSLALKSASNHDVFSQIASNPGDFSVLGLDPSISLIIPLFPSIVGLLAFIVLVAPLNNRTFKMTINGPSFLSSICFYL
jgi:hypothetical protein